MKTCKMNFLKCVILFITCCKGAPWDDSLIEHLQPDDVSSGRHDDRKNAPYNMCTRECIPGDCRTCYYRFYLEAYMTMNGACKNCPNTTSDCDAPQCIPADGFERAVLCNNRRMPGPSIQVCEHDRVVVDLRNMMPGRSTSIHWHGLRMQRTPHMDGVPMVNQCPIHESTTFRYNFFADHPGTFWYHSHVGFQKVDGLVGSLVVRRPKKQDPNGRLYDEDLPSHVIVIQDWMHDCADSLYPGIQKRSKPQLPKTYLIQGRGTYINGTIPWPEFNVTQGKRYRFRIIAATCLTCQFVFTCEGHDLTIIEADGQPTQPYTVKSLTMSPGERFSVVINCNQSVGSYWIQVRAGASCAQTRAHQSAVLRYRGHNGTPSTPRPGYDNVTGVNDMVPTMGPLNSDCSRKSLMERGPCVADLRSARKSPTYYIGEPDTKVMMAVGFQMYPNNTPYTNSSGLMYPIYFAPAPGAIFSSTVNGFSYQRAPSPLLSQYRDVPGELLCRQRHDVSLWNTEPRECVHVVKVPYRALVELLFVDARPLGLSHPLHLHGYDMCVVAQGKIPLPGAAFPERLAALYRDLEHRWRVVPKNCPLKDTLALTTDGFAMLRIYADNPGFWYFHCHFAYHLESGMAAVLQVGELEDMLPPPKDFPRCGDFLTPVKGCQEQCHSYHNYN